MAISEKQRQKKLQQKKRKRQQVARVAQHEASAAGKAASFASMPVHECMMPASLFEIGAGNVLFARRTGGDQIAFSFFLVDLFCLGVKGAFSGQVSEQEYEQRFKASILTLPGQGGLEQLEPACARKLVEGAVAFASELGFSPHAEYRAARRIFGDLAPGDCPTRFEYGRYGRPFYTRDPGETASQAKRIVRQLEKRCGADNYDAVIDVEGMSDL